MLTEQSYELITNLHIKLEQLNHYTFSYSEWDRFWVGCGLYEYVQIFIISNSTYMIISCNVISISGISCSYIGNLVLNENLVTTLTIFGVEMNCL